MGIVEDETAGEWDDDDEEYEEKEEEKKKKGMCAKLLKFFASLGGQYQIMQICYNDYVIVDKVISTETNQNALR